MGIEPTQLAWKARALPLSYTRIDIGRSDRIRTCDPLLPRQVLYQTELRPENSWELKIWWAVTGSNC